MPQIIPGNTSRPSRALLSITVDPVIEGTVSAIDLESKKGRKARSRALRKWSRWARSQTLKALSKDLGVTQKGLKPRVRISVISKQGMAELWIGLNPLPAHLAGKPKHTPQYRGTFVKGYYFEGAFVANADNSTDKVWRRKFRGPGSTSQGPQQKHLRGRFPLELQKISVEEVTLAAILSIEAKAPQRLRDIFAEELNFAFNVEPHKIKR